MVQLLLNWLNTTQTGPGAHTAAAGNKLTRRLIVNVCKVALAGASGRADTALLVGWHPTTFAFLGGHFSKLAMDQQKLILHSCSGRAPVT